jgi:hypothetical protein
VLSSISVRATNIIGALSSEGEFLFTVNVGNTNGHSYSLFIMKLVAHLDKQDPNWRMKTVLMMDNVVFHRGQIVMAVYHALKLPILFLGPYHFRMAPAELAFNYIKTHELPT